ncbi:putative F-box/LRR-repeat protein 19 [Macadamia integrifolia]|uniref:putative F-box/LRR-repeat protein 19 n=1 Tax=Macadamia integrifolia TaxID=60698 RepID=UPI001C4EDE77|nr:putative F-box/LRR-repeat protein 19 [Macadamia integrifolia]
MEVKCCPNLKHLSFDGSYNASEDAVLNIIRSCKRLQVIDFSDSPYVTEEVLEELGGNNCPCFRGIRRPGTISSFQASAIARNLPRLRLLNLSNTDLTDGGLSTILSGCLCLEYLDVRGCNFLKLGFHMIERATTQIIEFLYDPDEGYYDDSGDWFKFDRSDSIYW